jgi:hypothetical protein
MEPLKYVDMLNQAYQAEGHPPFKWSVYETAPWQKLPKPLSECRVSLLTTAGLSRDCDAPFDPLARNDLRLDAIPSDTRPDSLQVNDSYYDHRSVQKDSNCQFPIDALHKLAADGVIGEVAPRLWSGFMGRIYNRTELMEKATPAFLQKLREDEVDLLVLVPACPLDQQTASLVARVLEENGQATIVHATGRDVVAQACPPRATFINFPMGNAFGKAHDTAAQTQILRQVLEAAERLQRPGTIVDLPFDWGEEFDFFESVMAAREEAANS